MALVIILGAVVLLSSLIVVFLSRATLNREVSHTNAGITKADLLSRSALDIITGELRDEIADTARSTGTTVSNGSQTVYCPKKPDYFPPARLGLSAPTGSVIEVSADNTPIQPNGTIEGSSITIDTPSRNGRSFSAAAWYTSPQTSPQLGSNQTLPTWLFATRGNGITTPPVTDAANPASGNYVIGRFAYTIYDIGGLLNANTAGYDPTSAAIAAGAASKGSPAYADLTQLGFDSTTISAFTSWRNAVTGADANTFHEWATGVPRTSGAASASAMAVFAAGHRVVAFGDNAVLSRRDLLNNPFLSGSTSQLTHFSLSLNAPSYSPGFSGTWAVVSDTNPFLAAIGFVNSGSVTHFADDGTSTTYTASAGDPLLQRRFSLAKLAWLTYKGPSADLSPTDPLYNAGGTDDNIRACFGLQWSTNTVAGVAVPSWNYVGPSGSTLQASIETLSAVAAEATPREPNFFELLKAGILAGSVGRASDVETTAQLDQQNLEGLSDYQLFQIGVNTIDSAKTDNYPTTIAFTQSAATGSPSTTLVHGVQDLPYLYGVMDAAFSSTSWVSSGTSTPTAVSGTNKLNYASMVMAPLLFNPNASGSAPTAGPSTIRVAILSGTVTAIIDSYKGWGSLLLRSPNANLATANAPIEIPSSCWDTFRTGMNLFSSATVSSSTTFRNILPANVTLNSSVTNVHGFTYYNYTAAQNFLTPPQGTTPAPPTTCALRTNMTNVLIAMEYQDAAGNWIPYDTLAGNEAFLGAGTGVGASSTDFSPNLVFLYTSGTRVSSTLTSTGCTFKIDPRTTRFTGSRGSISSGAVAPVSGTSTYSGQTYNLPFSTISNPMYPGGWLLGGTDATANIGDNDGVTRPADGWLGSGANFFSALSATTQAVGRPVILHRPFQSVAELGYVFRGSPWKSLNFFDGSTGDGALLDLFSVSDAPAITAGAVNLNTRQQPVQAALINGVAQASDGSQPLTSGSAIASAFQTYSYSSSGDPASTLPENIANLPAFIASSGASSAFSTPVKSYRESVARALADSTQTRTWNLLIDVVAQTGRYPKSSASLSDFIVEGEKRCWLSIAIDRFTGKIVAQQLENVQ